MLNKISHPSTIICPLTTNVKEESEILRVHLKKGTSNIIQDSDIMMDQIRSINNKRLIKKVGDLPPELITLIKENIKIVLDIE